MSYIYLKFHTLDLIITNYSITPKTTFQSSYYHVSFKISYKIIFVVLIPWPLTTSYFCCLQSSYALTS